MPIALCPIGAPKTQASGFQHKDFSATVYAGDRIALIGDNGSGKTTLLKQILTHSSATPIGWMPQDFNEPEHLTVRAILSNAEQAAQDLLERLETETNYEEILEAIEQIDAFNWEVRVEKVLEEMRLTPLANRLYGQLSGGERMRLKLAKLLLRRPEVLLLDEPTDHLDQEMRSWFASFLYQWKGAAILVTHDLDLLMQWPNQIWCLEKGAVNLFSGTYSDYREEKQRRHDATEARRDQLIERKKQLVHKQQHEETRHARTEKRTKERYANEPLMRKGKKKW